MKPRVAIAEPTSRDAEYNQRALPQYISAVEAEGAEAVVIPTGAAPHEIAKLVTSCEAVLLPGSPADVDPQKFGAERHPKTAEADRARDNVDELLLQDAHNLRKPVLGICYGLQSLNVWRTGTLLQHIENTGVNHAAGRQVQFVHDVRIAPGSKLATILDATQIRVNSSHHQSAEQAGDGLRVVATCPTDGIIEALEGTAPEHFVVAVQWHPERTYEVDQPSKAIFREFVKAARSFKPKEVSESVS